MAKHSLKAEDEYIEMDLSSDATHSSRDFEFKMPFNAIEKETTSPADELFYQGKLLPLHIPPRLQMLQILLHNPTTPSNAFEKSTSSQCMTSCNIYIEELKNMKFWSRKFKLMKKSSLTNKLKATKTYLHSLFGTKFYSKLKEDKDFTSSMNVKSIMRSIERERMEEECKYRKSFSGAINCDLLNKSSAEISSCSSSSSSSSFSSVHSSGISMIDRSSSANSEMEKSILGAIEYCKKSHISARKSISL